MTMWGWKRRAVCALLGVATAGAALAPVVPGHVSSAVALMNCSGGDPALDTEEATFLDLINRYRAQHGLAPLALSANLTRTAAWMAQDMGAKGYFAHTDSLGRSASQRAQDCGYPGPAGENIAGGTLWPTAQDAFNAWRDSAGHNANMLGSPYTKIGIARAYVPGSPYTWYWVTDFGYVEDGVAAGLPLAGPEYGIRASTLAPGRWNVATVLAGGLRVRDLDGWTAWDQLPNGWWQQYGPDEFIPGNTTVGLLPVGMSMDRGRTAR